MFFMNYGFSKDWGNYAYTIKETTWWLSTYTTEICFCIVSEYELQLKFNAQNVDGCMMYVSVKPHICRM